MLPSATHHTSGLGGLCSGIYILQGFSAPIQMGGEREMLDPPGSKWNSYNAGRWGFLARLNPIPKILLLRAFYDVSDTRLSALSTYLTHKCPVRHVLICQRRC